MKIYYHPETFKGEGEWIVDRIGREFKKYSSHNVNLSLDNVDVWDFNLIWLGASFSWKMLDGSQSGGHYSDIFIFATGSAKLDNVVMYENLKMS